MPNTYRNKVVYNGTTLIDLTADTVTPAALAEGYTAHDKSGALITGTATGGSMVIRDEQDSHGGTIRSITAGSVVQGTKTITENGTYDVAEFADVDVQASGGSSYTFIYSTTMSVNTSSTTAISLDDVATGDTSIWTSSKMVYVKVRDTAGPLNGYFYGTDCMFTNNAPAMGLSSTSSYLMFGQIYKANASGVFSPVCIDRTTQSSAAKGYGVYPIRVNSDGRIEMNARYNSNYTGTIDGTYSVEVYLLGWPNDESPLYGN